MSSNVKLQIHNEMLSRMRALGNSERGFKELCSDLINQTGTDKKTFERIADGCFLSPETIRRMSKLTESEDGTPYRPNSDTIERILRYFGAEVTLNAVTISKAYRNQPKQQT